jgi:hypothetical protein
VKALELEGDSTGAQKADPNLATSNVLFQLTVQMGLRLGLGWLWRRHREFSANRRSVTATERSALTAHFIKWAIIIEDVYSQALTHYPNNDVWLNAIDVGCASCE